MIVQIATDGSSQSLKLEARIEIEAEEISLHENTKKGFPVNWRFGDRFGKSCTVIGS